MLRKGYRWGKVAFALIVGVTVIALVAGLPGLIQVRQPVAGATLEAPPLLSSAVEATDAAPPAVVPDMTVPPLVAAAPAAPQHPYRVATPESAAMEAAPPSYLAAVTPALAELELAAMGDSLPEGALQPRAAAALEAALQDEGVLVVDLVLNVIWGTVDPEQVITVAKDDDGAYGAARSDGAGFAWTPLWHASGTPGDVSCGGQLDVALDGAPFGSVSPSCADGGVDVLNDRVTGSLGGVTPGTHVTVTLGTWGYFGPGLPVVYAVLDSNSEFDIPVTGYDCTPGTFAQIDYADGDFLVRQYLYPYGAGGNPVFIAQNQGMVAGYTDPATTATVTVYEGDTTTVREGPLEVEAPGPYGFYTIYGAAYQPGDRIEVMMVGGTAETIAADLHDMTFDADGDAVSGTGPAGGALLLELQQFDEAAVEQATATADGDGSFGATFALDLRPRDWVAVMASDADGNATEIFGGPPFVSVYVDPYSEWDCVNGRVDGPGLPVMVSVTLPGEDPIYRENLLSVSDAGNTAGLGGACYLVWGSGWGPQDFPPGATVTLESSTWSGSVAVPELSWSADFDADEISGEAPEGELAVQVSQYEAGQYPLNGRATETLEVGPGGTFTASFGDFDVRHAGRVDWTHYDPDTDFAVSNANEANNLPFLQAAIGWGAFGYVAVPGEGVSVSLYEADGTTLVAESSNDQAVDDPRAFWFFLNPEVTAGQWLTVTTDSGWTTRLQVPDGITISYDEPNNLVWGDAPKGLVDVGHYTSDGWTFHQLLPSDGYILDTGALGHELGPMDGVEVLVPTSKGDLSSLYERIPGSALWVETWFEGEIGVGGNARLGVRYGNDGDLDAPDVTLTGSWSNLAYLSDTSGLPKSGTGPVVWQLGAVPAGESREFYVFAKVTGGDGDEASQTVAILSGDPDSDGGDPGRKTAQAWTGINSGGTQMTVGKWSWTGDPAPGNPVVFAINVCNSGPIGSSALTVRDALGDGLTYDSWWAREPGWVELDPGADDVALQYPSFPSWWCTEVYVRAIVDGSLRPGEDKVENVATITADNDENADDNTAYWEGWLSSPYVNLAVDKGFAGGVLIAGSDVAYNLNVYNWGNTPVAGPIRVTDTLPSGVTFLRMEQWNGPEAVLVQNSGGILAWEIDGLENGHWIDMQIVVHIDPETDPGSVLVNTFEVQPHPEDTNASDNSRTWTETVYPAGPNLRVRKWHEEWTWQRERSLVYYITFENVGDTPIYDVTLTDTLPEGVSWDGNGPDFWWEWDRLVSTDFVADDHLTWQFSVLYPGDSGTVHFRANPDDPDARLLTYTNTAEITEPLGDVNSADNTAVDEQFSGGEVDWVDIDVYRTRIWGCGPVGPFTVISKDGQWDFPGNCIDENLGSGFMPGDEITVQAGVGSLPVVITVPDPFTGFISSIDETVSGQIDSLDHEQVNVDLWGFPGRTTETDDHGRYSVTYTDIPQGAQGDVGYWTVIDYASVGFHHRLVNPDLTISVDYHDDWVNGNYEAGHTVWLTATTAGGTVKAVAELETASIPDWGGQEGFQTHWEDWSPSQPDLVPGDWVYASIDTGRDAQVEIGQMDLTLDIDNDTVDGVLNAPWTEPLDVSCEIHEEGGVNFWVYGVDPHGGAFTCDYGDQGFDVVPGTNVAIRYVEPDADSVYNRPENPAPWIRIEKWAEGSPAEGGNFTFHIRYINDGGMAAEGIAISDTMTGFSYLSDTSGVTPSGSGSGPIVWELGTLEPYSSGEFLVFVSVDAPAGEPVVNGAEISTTNEFNRSNPWDRYAEWSGIVQLNNTHIRIYKSAWTGDPVPGGTFVWVVNSCNHGSTGSSDVSVTDDLPAGTSLVSWWSPDSGWNEDSSSAQQLVVSRVSLAAGRCSEIRLEVRVDDTVPLGTELINTATVACANDIETDDNMDRNHVWTSPPHTNVYVDKWWNWGSLTPGGEIRYSVQIGNNGNVPVGTLRITDTLPAYTTFLNAWEWDTGAELQPLINADGVVVWEIPHLDNGFSYGFEIALRIDSDAPIGTELVNTAEITRLADEDSYDDNASRLVEQVYASGPNLRVTKWGDWHGDGDGHRAWYQFAVENIGDVQVDAATVQDTLPPDMILDGDVNTDYSRLVGEFVSYGPSGQGFSAELEKLHPGYRLDFSFDVRVTSDEGQIVAGGQWFTNTVSITTPPGDTEPANNTSSYGLDTGPDLYVSKTFVSGVRKPGELITFSLAIGNAQRGHTWWWGTQGNVWVTDTLPSGLTFVSAVRRSTGWADAVPAVNTTGVVAWNLGPLPTGAQDELLVTARIASTVVPSILTNRVTVASDQPDVDLEVDYADNSDTLDIPVALPVFKVSKTYAGAPVAGMPITFTLTVANTGESAGTTVVLKDTFLNIAHSWTIASIAAGATAQRTFSQELPCPLSQPVNSDYKVTSSAQGVVSEPGAPVTVTIIAPTIVPAFKISDTTLELGATLYVSDTTTTNGRRISDWTWTFGDGSAAVTTRTAQHVYADVGTYAVTLTVTDSCGFTASTLRSVTVTDSTPTYEVYLPLVLKNQP